MMSFHEASAAPVPMTEEEFRLAAEQQPPKVQTEEQEGQGQEDLQQQHHPASSGSPGSQGGHHQHPGSMDPTKYKTKLCRNFTHKGHCNFGATCMFAHGDRDLQTYGLRDGFPVGGAMGNGGMGFGMPSAAMVGLGSHVPGGPRADPAKFKTKLCKHFLSTGTCPFMDRCGFAHGRMELNAAVNGALPVSSSGNGISAPAGAMGGVAIGGGNGGQAPAPSGAPHAHALMAPMVAHPPPQHAGAYPPAGYEGFYSLPPGSTPDMHHHGGPLPQMKRPPVAELAKTRLCKHYSATGTCPYESRCLFAHGATDLRPREQAPPGMIPIQHVQRPMQVVPHVPVAMPVVPSAGSGWSWSGQYAYMPSS